MQKILWIDIAAEGSDDDPGKAGFDVGVGLLPGDVKEIGPGDESSERAAGRDWDIRIGVAEVKDGGGTGARTVMEPSSALFVFDLALAFPA